MSKRKNLRKAIHAGAVALWNAEMARGTNMAAEHWTTCLLAAEIVVGATAPDVYSHGYLDGHVCALGKKPKKPHACGVPEKYTLGKECS